MGSNAPVSRAAEALIGCQRLLVLTGAGASADSGVPTFRGAGGWYREHRGEDLATDAAFRRDPELVWEWYRERRMSIASSEPHAGQRAVALLQQHFRGRVLVATTNEDDLLERAGVDPVVHLHGSLFETRCADDCGWSAADDLDNGLSFLDCPRCGAMVRPGSVWFGESVIGSALTALDQFEPDGCLVVGSSVLVQPVSAIPPEMALAGLPVVEINPQETPLDTVATVSLRGGAKQFLPPLVDLLTSATIRSRAKTTDDMA